MADPRSPRRLAPRAGLSLVEIVVVCGVASVAAIFLGAAVITSARVNRETWVEREVVAVAAQAADELALALSQADRFTAAWGLSSAGDQLEFQAVWIDAAGQRVHGARLPVAESSPDHLKPGWAVRAAWVAEATLAESGLLDIDGDGDANDTVEVGRIELRYFTAPAASGGVEVPLYRRQIGGGAVRFVRHAFAGPGAPVRLFGRPPTINAVTGVDTPNLGQVVRTSAEATPGGASPPYPHGFGDPDPAVQLNLRVVYDPVPGGDGPQLHVFDVRRLVARR
ncbi:MAG: hypothetical protein M9894_33295 [Planctomycetes bacterium]|nr:hypothetical protein [Planctomycetota bacterium]